MQRSENGGIIISCDFCASDWDPATGLPPMMEGHHGSIICLGCLIRALTEARLGAGKFRCTLCLRENMPANMLRWSDAAHPGAIACRDCLNQAAGTFNRDPDVDWEWDRKKLADEAKDEAESE